MRSIMRLLWAAIPVCAGLIIVSASNNMLVVLFGSLVLIGYSLIEMFDVIISEQLI